MRDFDDELRAALAREEPPADFAERVLGRLTVDASQRRRPRARQLIVWAAAAALVAAVGGGIQYRNVQQAREERLRGEAAKEQVLQGLRIAGSKLQFVRAKIKEVGS